ncbi:MAG: glycosyltransferase [Chloroflexota bacterium]|jgi:cellulose synthase/poly-beta-1,6-N-acetylglucosamine synthase-like glycosyltransferase
MTIDWLLIPLALLYFLVVGVLFIYGINFFYLTYQTWHRPAGMAVPPPPTESEWPHVTVQLPLYNELYVAERIIDAAARLDYPAGRLEIQVLDDSTDETAAIVAAAVTRWQAKGVNIHHLHRQNRQGFKAGALQAGLLRTEGELIAIFDADFVPQVDYLRRIVPYFTPETAFVQARWGHLNRSYSLLTRLQAVAIDAHFVVEQFARCQAGYWFNFNGTAGVWRRQALLDAGGWRADTLTEDLDISYRALLRGWRAVYVRDLEVPAELPVSISAFRRQQHRWARGSLECALKLGPQVWRSAAPLSVKLEATLHLLGYGVHLLLFALVLLYPVVLLLSQQYPDLLILFGLAYFFNVTALAPTCFFLAGQQHLGQRWWRVLPRILFVTAVGCGLMVNTVRAALQIITQRQTVFERTAKFGIQQTGEDWVGKRYQLKLDGIVYWELALALLNLGTIVYALHLGNWIIAFYAAIFLIGLLYVAGLTLVQSLRLYLAR